MAVVVNNTTQLAESLPNEVANAALQSGTHSAMMIGPDGNPAVIPFEGIGQALQTGFTQPTSHHLDSALEFAKYSQPSEQLKTLAEGTAASATFGASTGIEKALGASPEAIRARREVNPGMHALGSVAGLTASSLTGVGEGALLNEAAQSIQGAVGGLKGAALAGAAEFGLMQSGDEMSKMLSNDPEQTAGNAAANIGYSALFGSVFGSGAKLAETGLNKAGIEIGKFADRLKTNLEPKALEMPVEEATQVASKPSSSLLDQYGKPYESETPLANTTEVGEPTLLNKPSKLSTGEKLADSLYKAGIEKGLSGMVAGAIGAGLGKLSGLPMGATAGLMLGNKAIKPFLDSIMPSLIKPLMESSTNPGAFQQAIQYSIAAIKGELKAANAVRDVLGSSTKVLSNELIPKKHDLDKLNSIVEHVMTNPQQVAEANPQLAHYMPNHVVSISSSLARAATYLNSIRPDTSKPGILDSSRVPSSTESAAYQRQLAIVEQPLMVLKHVKEGTLQPSDIATLNQVYPDYYNSLKTKMTAALADHLAKDEKVPYNQAMQLSLFLGQALDSSMQPMAIVANQAVHTHPMQQPQSGKQKGQKTDFKSVRLDASPNQAREMSKSEGK